MSRRWMMQVHRECHCWLGCSRCLCLRQISATVISRFVASLRMLTICSALNRDVFMSPPRLAADQDSQPTR